MPCNCLDDVCKTLRERGYTLNSTLFGKPDKPLFNLIRLDTGKAETRRGKPSTLMPDFCPFCGGRYEPFKSLVGPAEEWSIGGGDHVADR